MYKIHPHESLGHANFGWLDARHHFSFGDYHNPDRMGFGKLRVINDDRIKAGSGFDMHPHKNMEIITFVRSGAITHRDSKGNEGRTVAGDVQVMSAGSGIYHSEFNLENEDTTLFQIWVHPKKLKVPPRWESAEFSNRKANGTLPLLVSGRAEDQDSEALYIHQNASISGGLIESGQSVSYNIKDQVYLLVSDGEVDIFGHTLKKGDGMEIKQEESLTIKALTNAEVIVIDTP